MSKTEIVLELLRPLDDALTARLMRAYAMYGFFALTPEADGRRLRVTYDATRLTEEQVVSELRRLGIPVAPPGASAPAA
ncbi:MAG: hypothetical protein RMI94_02810 [Bryobacterales bacterium]|nr:hypothetical protein [Bryobacteraceae bacterium]MDW8129452.1 hypothetical protein [Bryobacterales bacterium]